MGADGFLCPTAALGTPKSLWARLCPAAQTLCPMPGWALLWHRSSSTTFCVHRAAQALTLLLALAMGLGSWHRGNCASWCRHQATHTGKANAGLCPAASSATSDTSVPQLRRPSGDQGWPWGCSHPRLRGLGLDRAPGVLVQGLMLPLSFCIWCVTGDGTLGDGTMWGVEGLTAPQPQIPAWNDRGMR